MVTNNNKIRSLLAVLFALLATVAVRAADEPQHKFEEMKVDESLKRSAASAVNAALMSGRFSDASQQASFDEYFQKYQLARWTEAKNITSLPKFRQDLGNQLRKKSAGAGAEVHDHLNALVLEIMKKIAAGPYHPASQVNAMLMIGELNSVESSSPTPLPEALDVLLATVGSTKLRDGVRAAAMVGIQRHVDLKIADAETRRNVATAMLKVVGEELPSGVERRGREWILGQALTVLADLKAVGENNAVFNAMVKTVGNSKLSLSTRGIAANSLGKLNYSGAAGINPVTTADVLASLMVDVCSAEIKKSEASGNEVSRRRVHQFASYVLTALLGEGDSKGIASLARDDAQKAHLAAIQKSVETIITFLDAKKSEEKDADPPVKKLQSELEGLLKKKG